MYDKSRNCLTGHRALVGVLALIAFSAANPPVALGQSTSVTVLEPGYKVTYYDGCGYGFMGGPPPYPGPPGGQIQEAACTPGGPWGDLLVLSVYTPWDDYGSYVESVDFSGNVGVFASEPGKVRPTHLAFSPLGWRGGDSFFMNILCFSCIDEYTYMRQLDPSGATIDYYNFRPGSVGRVAVDPSGAFANDLFMEIHGIDTPGIYRVDNAGNLSLFSTVGGVQRFGPGGAWGTGLYGDGQVLAPDATATPFPGGFGSEMDWGFDGDMFTNCGSGQICRVKPDGSRTLFAETPGGHLAFCGGSLWIAQNGCWEIIQDTARVGTVISPSTLNVRSRGSDLSFYTTLWDGVTGELLDASLLSPAYISSVWSPSIGTVLLPVPRAEPGCDDATEDGIWETMEDRVLQGTGTMALRFSTPSDGLCETRDGNRQEILALLLDVLDGEMARICYTSTHPDFSSPIVGCGAVKVLNRGNR